MTPIRFDARPRRPAPVAIAARPAVASFDSVGTPECGETIVTSLWREPGRIVIAAATKEHGTPVMSHAAITLR